ncbi:MAG: carbohydrate kinase family protein [Clostridiales bacterium]|nr:carbohydrate kinase family protein [Clostridiales bacterium]
MNNRGIAIAGNMLVDNVKTVDTFPNIGMLANITGVQRAVGGCVPNTIIDIAKMKAGIPLTAIGLVGEDEPGQYVIDMLAADGVDTTLVSRTNKAQTSFSDAMCALDTGERTFFHYRGANALFSPEYIPLDKLDCDILHIGYILLLDAFDARDEEYGTVMARFLHEVQQRGIRTSIDVVSDESGKFAETVVPALKYCDYAIMNEIEAGSVSGLPVRDESGKLIAENIRKTLEQFMAHGVKHRAIIHCPECGFCMDAEEGFVAVPSLNLPEGYVKGSVGAGDAFAAGSLCAIYQEMTASDMLAYASAAAAANLSAADSVSGMKVADELKIMMNEWERKTL